MTDAMLLLCAPVAMVLNYQGNRIQAAIFFRPFYFLLLAHPSSSLIGWIRSGDSGKMERLQVHYFGNCFGTICFVALIDSRHFTFGLRGHCWLFILGLVIKNLLECN